MKYVKFIQDEESFYFSRAFGGDFDYGNFDDCDGVSV